MDIDQKYLPVYRDATILMRPKTGLRDMFLELDPAPSARRGVQRGDAVPVSNTAPDVNLDEVLEALDTDTRAYLRMLLVGGGSGPRGRGDDLGELLGSLGPVNRDLAKLNREVAKRRDNLANLIHNMNLLFGRVGQEDEEIAALIDASNASSWAIAPQDLDVRRATGELGPTLRETRVALEETGKLAEVLGPALNDLRPFARRLSRSTARSASSRARPRATSGTGSGRSPAPRAGQSATCGPLPRT